MQQFSAAFIPGVGQAQQFFPGDTRTFISLFVPGTYSVQFRSNSTPQNGHVIFVLAVPQLDESIPSELVEFEYPASDFIELYYTPSDRGHSIAIVRDPLNYSACWLKFSLLIESRMIISRFNTIIRASDAPSVFRVQFPEPYSIHIVSLHTPSGPAVYIAGIPAPGNPYQTSLIRVSIPDFRVTQVKYNRIESGHLVEIWHQSNNQSGFQ